VDGISEEKLCGGLRGYVAGGIEDAHFDVNVYGAAGVPAGIDRRERDLPVRIGVLVAAQKVPEPLLASERIADRSAMLASTTSPTMLGSAALSTKYGPRVTLVDSTQELDVQLVVPVVVPLELPVLLDKELDPLPPHPSDTPE